MTTPETSRAHRWTTLAFAAVALLLSACGGGNAIGEQCATDGDCAAGSSCIVFPVANGSCAKGIGFCTNTCSIDRDCVPLRAYCQASCGGGMACEGNWTSVPTN